MVNIYMWIAIQLHTFCRLDHRPYWFNFVQEAYCNIEVLYRVYFWDHDSINIQTWHKLYVVFAPWCRYRTIDSDCNERLMLHRLCKKICDILSRKGFRNGWNRVCKYDYTQCSVRRREIANNLSSPYLAKPSISNTMTSGPSLIAFSMTFNLSAGLNNTDRARKRLIFLLWKFRGMSMRKSGQ